MFYSMLIVMEIQSKINFWSENCSEYKYQLYVWNALKIKSESILSK